MTPLGGGEAIWVGRLAGAGAPADFTWRGRRHLVRAVEAWREGGRARSLYRIRTAGGMRCLISVDSSRTAWRMERVLPRKEA